MNESALNDTDPSTEPSRTLRRVDVDQDDTPRRPTGRGVPPHEVPSAVQATDQVTVRFKPGTKIENRRPGRDYVVSSDLAYHYTSVRKFRRADGVEEPVAIVVADPNKRMQAVQTTAMTSPRGRARA